MLPRRSLNFFSARTYCWLMFNLSARTPRSFPAELLSSWSVPSPYCHREGFHPSYKTWHWVLLNSIISLSAVLSFTEVALNSSFFLQHTNQCPQFGAAHDLLRIHSITLSRSLMKTICFKFWGKPLVQWLHFGIYTSDQMFMEAFNYKVFVLFSIWSVELFNTNQCPKAVLPINEKTTA